MKPVLDPRLILLVVLLALLQLWIRPVLPVDETRYLSVAWEMWLRGDWLVPYLNGEAYSHKPPLLFWLIGLTWSVFGVSEWPARLLGPLVALLTLWWTARLARLLWPADCQREQALAPWLLFGGLFWMNFYTLVQFDLWLGLAALLAWAGSLALADRPLAGWLLLAAGTGLGILFKGPVVVILVLPALLLAPWWLPPGAAVGRWFVRAMTAFGGGVLLALAWAIPAGEAGGPVYREAIFWGQSAGRVVDSFAHRNPWWSYLWWLPLMWLPWLIWPRLWRALRGFFTGPLEPGTRFCLAVLLPALLVFSFVSGKQGKYLLPLFPLMALLMARALARANSWSTPLRLPLMKTTGTGAAVRGITVIMAALTAMFYITAVVLVRPNYDLTRVSRDLNDLQVQGAPLAWLGKYHGQFHFLGQLKKPVAPFDRVDELREWLRSHPEGYLLVYQRGENPPAIGNRSYPYRSGSLVLWPARELLESPGRLDAVLANA